MKVYRIHGHGWFKTYRTEQEFNTALQAINEDPFESVVSTQILERIDLPHLRDTKSSNADLNDPTFDIFDVRKLLEKYISHIKQGSSDEKTIFILPEQRADVVSLLVHSGLNV